MANPNPVPPAPSGEVILEIRPNIGHTILGWIDLLRGKTRDELQQIADDPHVPIVQAMAAAHLLRGRYKTRKRGNGGGIDLGLILDRSVGKRAPARSRRKKVYRPPASSIVFDPEAK